MTPEVSGESSIGMAPETSRNTDLGEREAENINNIKEAISSLKTLLKNASKVNMSIFKTPYFNTPEFANIIEQYSQCREELFIPSEREMAVEKLIDIFLEESGDHLKMLQDVVHDLLKRVVAEEVGYVQNEMLGEERRVDALRMVLRIDSCLAENKIGYKELTREEIKKIEHDILPQNVDHLKSYFQRRENKTPHYVFELETQSLYYVRRPLMEKLDIDPNVIAELKVFKDYENPDNPNVISKELISGFITPSIGGSNFNTPVSVFDPTPRADS